MNTITWRGPSGQVRWAYYTAAELAAWEVSGSTLTATVVSHDALRIQQQPLTFVVPRSTGSWVWSIQSLQMTGTSLTATVSPQEG